jgi:hypothetical protein
MEKEGVIKNRKESPQRESKALAIGLPGPRAGVPLFTVNDNSRQRHHALGPRIATRQSVSISNRMLGTRPADWAWCVGVAV